MIWYWDFVEYDNHSIFKFFKCFRLYWYGGKYHSNKNSWHTRLYIFCTDNGLNHALLTFTWWNMFVTIKYLDVFIIWVDVFMRYRALKHLNIFVNFLIIFTGKNQQFFRCQHCYQLWHIELSDFMQKYVNLLSKSSTSGP